MFEKNSIFKIVIKNRFCFLLFHQASNPYIGKLSILDDELALNVCITKNIKEKFQNCQLAFVYLYLQHLDRLAQFSLNLVCMGPLTIAGATFLTLCEKCMSSLTSPLLTGDADSEED